ncbi:18.3 kDa class I heat shock protein-like [Magnolia sinica]|uniref:18.3 kDa class I heat shock protein-like n=1 Tax=Magnolia sinica TaxID=86752 RepID=UPI00265871DB|nr:18.3 kDa class I heat shock protein-like [Magnolia sinica]
MVPFGRNPNLHFAIQTCTIYICINPCKFKSLVQKHFLPSLGTRIPNNRKQTLRRENTMSNPNITRSNEDNPPSKPNMARSYEDIQPLFDWKREDGSDTLLISLPGFKKDQLKVNLDRYGMMKISGERQIDGNQWSRFSKNFDVPENCIQNKICASFEKGYLRLNMPKTATQAQHTWCSTPESCKCSGGGFFFGLNMSRKMVVGVVVATLVGVVLGICVACNVRCLGRYGN